MFERIYRSWEITKTSFRIMQKDKQILLFPLISAVAMGIIIGSFIGAIFFAGIIGMPDTAYPIIVVLSFLIYFVLYFIVIYFNVAMIGFVMIRLQGGTPTLNDGFKTANSNLSAIIKWTIVSAIIGMILRAIEEKAGWIGKIIIGFIGVAWSLITYFILPVLIFEKLPMMQSLKRSASLFKQTWGETAIGGFGIGFVFGLLAILGIIPIILGGIIGGFWGLIAGFIIAVIYWFSLGIIATAVSAIYETILYRYATTGKIAEDFPQNYITKPWA